MGEKERDLSFSLNSPRTCTLCSGMFGSFLTFYTLASHLPLGPKTKENRAAPFKKPRAKAGNHEKSSKMVGLSIVLEQEEGEEEAPPPHQRHHRWHGYATSEVINNSNMSMLISNNPGAGTRSPSSASTPSSPSPSPSPAFPLAFPAADFLNQCFLCRTKLSPGKDIYMYRGDRAFCSEECRCRQILLDEEEALRRDNQNQSHCSSAAHPSSSRNRRGSRNRASSGGV